MTDKLRMSALNAREAQCIRGGDDTPPPTDLEKPFPPDIPVLPNDKTRVQPPLYFEPVEYQPSEGGTTTP